MSSASLDRILDRADAEWMARKTLEMVEIKSVTMDEAEMCRYYADALRSLGLAVDVREVTPGRNNLYARIPGTGGGPTLALNGHVDTVPIHGAWPPKREGDLIYGRGTTDMKGPMAAVLGAAKALIESGVKLKGDLVISAVVGHEEAIAAKDGPKAYIEDLNSGRTKADRILIVEGEEDIWLMSMGSANFVITLTSDRGGTHTNNTPFGENPIRFMGELIAWLLDSAAQRLPADPAAWTLGTARTTRIRHRWMRLGKLGRIPGLNRAASPGIAVMPGGCDTPWLTTGHDGASIGPVFRMVIDLADPDRSMAVLAGGQSGHSASGHATDQLPLWIRSQERSGKIHKAMLRLEFLVLRFDFANIGFSTKTPANLLNNNGFFRF